jgi:hypothetical protein
MLVCVLLVYISSIYYHHHGRKTSKAMEMRIENRENPFMLFPNINKLVFVTARFFLFLSLILPVQIRLFFFHSFRLSGVSSTFI